VPFRGRTIDEVAEAEKVWCAQLAVRARGESCADGATEVELVRAVLEAAAALRDRGGERGCGVYAFPSAEATGAVGGNTQRNPSVASG
jgi:hypothetical protein